MEDDIEVIGEASNGNEAIGEVMIKTSSPSIDINMPDLNGIGVTKVIKEERHRCKIVILTIYDDREYLLN